MTAEIIVFRKEIAIRVCSGYSRLISVAKCVAGSDIREFVLLLIIVRPMMML